MTDVFSENPANYYIDYSPEKGEELFKRENGVNCVVACASPRGFMENVIIKFSTYSAGYRNHCVSCGGQII